MQTHIKIPDNLVQLIQAYAKENMISLSAAVRILVKRGLEAQHNAEGNIRR